MTNIKTLNRHYRRRQRNKTQRANKKKHGGMSMMVPGNHHDFADDDKFDRSSLDALMESNHPLVVRHHSDTCQYCKDFDPAWRAITNSLSNHSTYGAASFGPRATKYLNDNYYQSPVKKVPTVMVIHEDRRDPKEHTGPNTLEALEEFLKEHGMQLKIVPVDNNSFTDSAPMASDSMASDSMASDSMASDSMASDSMASDSMAPEPPAGSEPPAAPSVIDNIKTKVKDVDDAISSGLGAITGFMTKDFTKSNDETETTPAETPAKTPDANANAFPTVPQPPAPVPALVPAPVPALVPASVPLDDKNVIVGAPQVPSIGGRRKKTRRKHNHKHKPNPKTKRSQTKRRKQKK